MNDYFSLYATVSYGILNNPNNHFFTNKYTYL